MILRTISRRWTAVLAFSLMTAAFAGAGAQEETQRRMSIPRPRPGLTCANVVCAASLTCVMTEGRPHCGKPTVGLKVGDLKLYACVNGLDTQGPPITVPAGNGTKAQKESFPRLQPRPMPVGGTVPKPPVAGMTKEEFRAINCLKKSGYFEKQRLPNDAIR